MRLRSLLFVPGDRPERMEKALSLGADALILDLEDSVGPDRKALARDHVASFLRTRSGRTTLLVRINPPDSDQHAADLDAILPGPLDGLMLPKCEDAGAVTALLERLDRPLPILPIATETPSAIFGLGSYRTVSNQLCGLTWGAEDLPAAIGAARSRDETGRFTPPYELARSLTLFAAHAAGVAAIETVYPAFRDLDGLTSFAGRAAEDGFTGMMAIHPSQVPIINAAFSPSLEALAHARAVVAAFADRPGAGALQLDGRMIDAPHLRQARRLLGK
jgi:citrate lyase subunit beta/citryl-CoA lyase